MKMNLKCGVVKENELDSAAAELELVIQRMAERENDEREKITKRYTSGDEKEMRMYEIGFAEGFKVGQEKGYAEGWDAAMKEARKEEEKESD